MWTYLLKTKSETFDAFKRFRALVENVPDKRIESFRTDSGGEFLSREFIQYCEDAGIRRQSTAPYSLQQNGIAERRNRTMIEMARSLLLERGLPLSKAVIYLGKEPGTKAHRLYDPLSKSICICRDVEFVECKSWDWSRETESRASQKENFVVITHEASRHEDICEDDSDILQTPVTPPTATLQSGTRIESSNALESVISSSSSEENDQPMNYKSLTDIYNATEPVELEEEELLLMGVDEPSNFNQAAKMGEWTKTIKAEMDAMERNKTKELVQLPPGRKPIGLNYDSPLWLTRKPMGKQK
ncbi:uncharacterized protein LOC141661251 [Apium graveolens]|uniref:uncharacterized protein LOC141661251 n=1 Tax=Apium graveolens TaxID=4045 RepID=UPI003D79155B